MQTATASMKPDLRVLMLAGCNIALYYYSGFCYLLLRRYTDAARAFNNVLNYIARSGSCYSVTILDLPVAATAVASCKLRNMSGLLCAMLMRPSRDTMMLRVPAVL